MRNDSATDSETFEEILRRALAPRDFTTNHTLRSNNTIHSSSSSAWLHERFATQVAPTPTPHHAFNLSRESAPPKVQPPCVRKSLSQSVQNKIIQFEKLGAQIPHCSTLSVLALAIRKEWQRLAHQKHPDKNSNGSSKVFQELLNCYRDLKENLAA